MFLHYMLNLKSNPKFYVKCSFLLLSRSNIISKYFRDFEVETIGLKETSRFCSDEKYGARLGDIVLDWEVSDAMATLAGAEYWDNDVAVAII
ncbi:hypothetical protein HN51_012936 [Arachis hypogaea]